MERERREVSNHYHDFYAVRKMTASSVLWVPGQIGADALGRQKNSFYRVRQMLLVKVKEHLTNCRWWLYTNELTLGKVTHTTSALPLGKIWPADLTEHPNFLLKCQTSPETSVERNKDPSGKYGLLFLPWCEAKHLFCVLTWNSIFNFV